MKKEKESKQYYDTPGGTLSRLKDRIYMIMRLTPTRLNDIVEAHLIKKNGGVSNRKTQSDKTNAINAFNEDEISIKTYFKFLRAFDPEKIEQITRMTLRDGQVIEVSDVTVYGEEQNLSIPRKRRKGVKNEANKPSDQ